MPTFPLYFRNPLFYVLEIKSVRRQTASCDRTGICKRVANRSKAMCVCLSGHLNPLTMPFSLMESRLDMAH